MLSAASSNELAESNHPESVSDARGLISSSRPVFTCRPCHNETSAKPAPHLRLLRCRNLVFDGSGMERAICLRASDLGVIELRLGRCFSEPFIEPFQRPLEVVLPIGWFYEYVSLIGIHDELYRNVHGFQGVPPFDGLLDWHFAVAVADQDQRRRFDVPHEVHGITLGIHRRIVVDRSAKEGNHPLVDLIYAIVAEPVRKPGTGHRCRKTMRLRLRPHGHVAAVTVPADTEASRVDGILLRNCVDPGHDVAEIAAAKIFDVPLCEGFPLSVTPARIGAECEVAHGGLRANVLRVPPGVTCG